jgi:DHA1 family bicyclomycin/chloramphenicol resistance-like MFS transporter
VRIPPQSFAFTLFLGALGTILPLSIDMSLPALTAIARGLETTPALASLTLSLFLAGFSIAPLAFGPWSDRHGRRPVLLTGLAIFTCAGLACTFAPSIELLLLARLVQGAGAGAGVVLILAIIRDVFEGPTARAKLSYVRVVQTIAPMIAPTLGVWTLAFSGWRAIYAVLCLSGATLFVVVAITFAESAVLPDRSDMRPTSIIANYRAVLTNRVCSGFATVNAFSFASLFAYISGSPLVLLDTLSITPSTYGLVFATTAFSIMLGAFASGRMNHRGAHEWQIMAFGLFLAGGSALLLFLMIWARAATIVTMLPLLIGGAFATGLVLPNAAHAMLEPLPELAGSASAILSSSQMICASFSGAAVAFLYTHFGAVAMPAVMTFCCSVSLAAFAQLTHRRSRASDPT